MDKMVAVINRLKTMAEMLEEEDREGAIKLTDDIKLIQFQTAQVKELQRRLGDSVQVANNLEATLRQLQGSSKQQEGSNGVLLQQIDDLKQENRNLTIANRDLTKLTQSLENEKNKSDKKARELADEIDNIKKQLASSISEVDRLNRLVSMRKI